MEYLAVINVLLVVYAGIAEATDFWVQEQYQYQVEIRFLLDLRTQRISCEIKSSVFPILKHFLGGMDGLVQLVATSFLRAVLDNLHQINVLMHSSDG